MLTHVLRAAPCPSGLAHFVAISYCIDIIIHYRMCTDRLLFRQISILITCSAVILYADWPIGVRPVDSISNSRIQYRTAEFNITT